MSTDDKYSAGEQSLGYTYQARLALLHLLRLPEETALLFEKDDDLDFVDSVGGKTLASLKHKAAGDRITDLSVDFWKSVNIWLVRYKRDRRSASVLRFFMFSTACVVGSSFQSYFTVDAVSKAEDIVELADRVLAETTSKVIVPIKVSFDELSAEEKRDFLSRITIFDNSPRIENIPEAIINQHMRTIATQYRRYVYERLEGWWSDVVIKLLTGSRSNEVYSREISDKLASISDEYKSDNLPITFRGASPEGTVDPQGDSRLFVKQLRAIGIKPDRIESAIIDYYRAFEQRASWARQHVLLDGEVEEYEDRLTDEWRRTKDVVFENLDDAATEEIMQNAGRELYKWAEMNTNHLRIRDRVSEPYVIRGSMHILANENPEPKVHWHPQFLSRLRSALGGPAK